MQQQIALKRSKMSSFPLKEDRGLCECKRFNDYKLFYLDNALETQLDVQTMKVVANGSSLMLFNMTCEQQKKIETKLAEIANHPSLQAFKYDFDLINAKTQCTFFKMNQRELGIFDVNLNPIASLPTGTFQAILLLRISGMCVNQAKENRMAPMLKVMQVAVLKDLTFRTDNRQHARMNL